MGRKLSYENVRDFIEIESNSECKLLSEEYIGIKYALIIQCACGNIFNTSFNTFKYSDKQQCNSCSSKKVTKTNEEFLNQVYSLVKNEYTFMENYKTTKDKINCRHNKCGHVWKIKPSEFLRGNRCPKCSIEGRTKSNEQFTKEIYDLVGDEYIFLEDYKIGSIKIKCRHNTCKYEWSITPSNFLNGKRCPVCRLNNRKLRITNDEFIERVHDLVGDEYTILEEYKGMEKKILIRHNCKYCDNNEFEMTANNFIGGNRCPKCGIRSRTAKLTKTHSQFVQDVKDLFKEEYQVVGKYKTNKIKIDIMHNKCGHIWKVTPDNLLRGYGCPNCVNSKGEKRVYDYLTEYKVPFFKEYIFDDCANIRPLPFDFYISDINLCIEYDGKQHFEPVNFGGVSDEVALENYKSLIKNDDIKTQYCADNNIPLLRIPYWQFDKIEEILEKWISKYELIHKKNIKEIA